MNQLIKSAMERAGIYYAKRQYMPCGIDWLWDVRRIVRGRPVRTVFDVGANIGQTTRLIKERFPEAAVHAFEPVSSTYQSLERNVRHFLGVTCHRTALCERVGTATMTAASDSQINRLVPDTEVPGVSQIETVDTETLDHFCASYGIGGIDILKVDAEGADLRVLQGGQELLRQGGVAFVFVEVGFDENDAGHVHFPEVYDFLKTAGLTPYSFYDYCHEDEGCRLVFTNVLFLSPAAIRRTR